MYVHLIIGCSIYLVCGALCAAAERAQEGRSWADVWTTLFIWPFVAPFVLGRALVPEQDVSERAETSRVHEVAQRFRDACTLLDPATQEILSVHLSRVEEAISYGKAMEQRAVQLSHMVRSPEFDAQRIAALQGDLEQRGYQEDDIVMLSVINRHHNIRQLHTMLEETGQEIERVVLSLEDLAMQLALIRVGGATPKSHLLEGLTASIQHICTEPLDDSLAVM